MVLSTLDAGWDEQYGGILHFASVRGGEPDGDNSGFETEPMSVQLSASATASRDCSRRTSATKTVCSAA